MLLEGLYIPLTTPFRRDGRLHPYKLAANVLRYSKSPASGLIALAPHIGEPTLLTDAETLQVLETAARYAAPEKVLLANISRDSVPATLALAENAAELGYDAGLVGRPAMLAPMHHREKMAYFRTVADRSRLPIILSSVSRNDAVISWMDIAELATHPNVLGLYSHEIEFDDHAQVQPFDLKNLLDRTRSVQRQVTVTHVFTAVTNRMLRAAAHDPGSPAPALVSAAALARNPAAAATATVSSPAAVSLKTRTKTVGFQVLAAEPDYLLNALRSGAAAIAPAFAACAPQPCYEVYAAWKDNDQPLAEEKQQRIDSAANFAETLGPAALKHGCDLNGYYGGPARLPWLSLSTTERTALEERMRSLRN